MGSAEPKTSAAGAVGGAATASAVADGALAWWNEVLSNAPELGSAASNKLSSTIEGLSTKLGVKFSELIVRGTAFSLMVAIPTFMGVTTVPYAVSLVATTILYWVVFGGLMLTIIWIFISLFVG